MWPEALDYVENESLSDILISDEDSSVPPPDYVEC
jgi:hypothetical protein